MWSGARVWRAPEHREADPTIAGGQVSLRGQSRYYEAPASGGRRRSHREGLGAEVQRERRPRGGVSSRKRQLLEKDNKRETKDNERDRAARTECALPNG